MPSAGHSRLKWRRSCFRRCDIDLLSFSPLIHGYQKTVNAKLTLVNSDLDLGPATGEADLDVCPRHSRRVSIQGRGDAVGCRPACRRRCDSWAMMITTCVSHIRTE